MYLWTQDVPSNNMRHDPFIFPPHSRYSRSIRALPRVQTGSHLCSPLDLNEAWLAAGPQHASSLVDESK